MADLAHQRLSDGPLPLAHLVHGLRDTWGKEHGVASVHGFAREVASCLLRHEDVEVGDLEKEKFVPWKLEPWDADEKIDRELMSMDTFLNDDTPYVFHRKQGKCL